MASWEATMSSDTQSVGYFHGVLDKAREGGVRFDPVEARRVDWMVCIVHDMLVVSPDPGGDPYCWQGYWNGEVDACKCVRSQVLIVPTNSDSVSSGLVDVCGTCKGTGRRPVYLASIDLDGEPFQKQMGTEPCPDCEGSR